MYYIVDGSQNTNKPYIDAVNYKNSGDKEGCLAFETEIQAQDFIDSMEWNDWAFISFED